MVFLPRFYYTLVTAFLLALASTGVATGMTASLVLTLMLTGAVLPTSHSFPAKPCAPNARSHPSSSRPSFSRWNLPSLTRAKAPAAFEVIDSPPIDFTGPARFSHLRLPPRQEITQTYTLKSIVAAASLLARFSIAPPGPLGLIQRQGKIDLPRTSRYCRHDRRRFARLQLALAGAMQAGQRNHRFVAKAVSSNPCANTSATTTSATSTGKPRQNAASSSVGSTKPNATSA